MKKILLGLSIATLVLFNSCTALQGLVNMTNCKYKAQNVDNMRVAGVNLSGINNINQIKTTDYAKLGLALLGKQLPISHNVNVMINNPNEGAASVSRIDWILKIDNKEVVRGNTGSVSVAGKTTKKVPINMSYDLYKLVSNGQMTDMLNLAILMLNEGGDASRITILIKPSISVNGVTIAYPNYFAINSNFTEGK